MRQAHQASRAPKLTFDYGPLLKDYARFRGEPLTLYIIPVGYPSDREARVHLGPLLTFHLTP